VLAVFLPVLMLITQVFMISSSVIELIGCGWTGRADQVRAGVDLTRDHNAVPGVHLPGLALLGLC
jgi:hypothetical protein